MLEYHGLEEHHIGQENNQSIYMKKNIKNIFYITCICLLQTSCQESNASHESKIESPVEIFNQEENEISFLFMGDFMQHQPQIDAAKTKNNEYDYHHYFDYTGSLINGVDFAIANLEVTLAGEPYAGYPKFCAPDEYAIAIKDAGFDVLTTANNHSNDRGSKGLERTINILDSLKIPHLGTYINEAERKSQYPFIINKNNIKVALLNYTYGTNGLATKYPNIVNMIEEDMILSDIKECRESNVDKIIAIMHWGTEYLSFPDKYQKKWGEWLLSNGVDIVIGGHPHWVQPIEFRDKDSVNNEKLIVWSLGNIVSNQRREHTDGGSSLQFSIYRNENGEVGLKDVGYHLHWVWKYEKDNQTKYQILPISKIEKMNIQFDEKSKKEMNIFINNERSLYNNNNINAPEYKYNQEDDSYLLQ